MTMFSAAHPAFGYLHQVRGALHWSLRRARTGAGFLGSLELNVHDTTATLAQWKRGGDEGARQ